MASSPIRDVLGRRDNEPGATAPILPSGQLNRTL